MLRDKAAFAEPGVKATKIWISVPESWIFFHAGRLLIGAVSALSVDEISDVRDKPGWTVAILTAGRTGSPDSSSLQRNRDMVDNRLIPGRCGSSRVRSYASASCAEPATGVLSSSYRTKLEFGLLLSSEVPVASHGYGAGLCRMR